jgi:hypothetical protein
MPLSEREERILAEIAAIDPGADPVFEAAAAVHLADCQSCREAARARGHDEAAAEVAAALRSQRRDQAAREFRDALRRFEADKIHVFRDMLAD